MEELHNKILNDKEIIKIYDKIHELEDSNKGYAYHDFSHVLNVSNLVEQILIMLNYDKDIVYSAKIAALLHDTGAREGKKDHAQRSYEYAKEYFKKHNIEFKYKEQVLEAIRIHSDGFDTENIIALALILSDKLDVKYTRVATEGKDIVGNRQFLNIDDITIEITNNTFKVNFVSNDNLDIKELNEYYFTKKIFKAIQAFASKVGLKYSILMNSKAWNLE